MVFVLAFASTITVRAVLITTQVERHQESPFLTSCAHSYAHEYGYVNILVCQNLALVYDFACTYFTENLIPDFSVTHDF